MLNSGTATIFQADVALDIGLHRGCPMTLNLPAAPTPRPRLQAGVGPSMAKCHIFQPGFEPPIMSLCNSTTIAAAYTGPLAIDGKNVCKSCLYRARSLLSYRYINEIVADDLGVEEIVHLLKERGPETLDEDF